MVQGVETVGQSGCVRQIVAPHSDTLSGPAALHRHRHAGYPAVACVVVVGMASVLKAFWRQASSTFVETPIPLAYGTLLAIKSAASFDAAAPQEERSGGRASITFCYV
jgi:hypothetical protein